MPPAPSVSIPCEIPGISTTEPLLWHVAISGMCMSCAGDITIIKIEDNLRVECDNCKISSVSTVAYNDALNLIFVAASHRH